MHTKKQLVNITQWLRPLWECIGNNFIAKIQVPSYPQSSNTTPAQTGSLHTAAADDQAAGRGADTCGVTFTSSSSFLPHSLSTRPSVPPPSHILQSLLSASTLSLSVRHDNEKKVLQQHLQRHDISFKLSKGGWARSPPAGWGWPAGLEVGVTAS